MEPLELVHPALLSACYAAQRAGSVDCALTDGCGGRQAVSVDEEAVEAGVGDLEDDFMQGLLAGNDGADGELAEGDEDEDWEDDEEQVPPLPQLRFVDRKRVQCV